MPGPVVVMKMNRDSELLIDGEKSSKDWQDVEGTVWIVTNGEDQIVTMYMTMQSGICDCVVVYSRCDSYHKVLQRTCGNGDDSILGTINGMIAELLGS